MTITLKLSPEEARILDRVALAMRATRSEALRALLMEKGRQLEREAGMTAHDYLKRYIPESRGPVRKRSIVHNVSDEVYKIILEKHRGRSIGTLKKGRKP